MSAPTLDYSRQDTLGIRVELIRQIKRRRTLVAFLLVIALPLIVVAAVKFGPSSDNGGGGNGGGGFGDGDFDLVGLATSGAWNFSLTMLLFSSGFLLIIIAAMFMGDTVASEASWSTLRYLLVAPVPRRKLLWTKAIVGLILTAIVLLTLVVASWAIGAVAFGTGPLASPFGGALSQGESLERLSIITTYIAITLLFPAGFAFLMSVLTDVPLGAVGTAVIVVIVLNILDAIEALGTLRRFLPTDYGAAWVDALNPVVIWDEMAVGAAYNLIAFALLIAIAVLRFDRKDITS
jgi:ABC-2 type transport system permease protein